MKASEIKNLTDQELDLKERQIREDIQKARFKKFTGELADTAQLKRLKKALARILTETRTRRPDDAVKAEG